MKKFLIAVVLCLMLSGCMTASYPSPLRDHIKHNRYPMGANILTTRYFHHLKQGLSSEHALRKARQDYIRMLKILEETNPAHLYNMEIPKITKL